MTETGTRTVRTMCPMNCQPTFCGMQVQVEGDQLLKITGDKDNPDSQGFLCVRGRAAREIIGNDKRILYPMARDRRAGGEWQRIGWDEALGRIASAIDSGRRDETALWPGHGSVANDFAVFAHAQLAMRLANNAGFQWWEPSMICWGLGGLGVGLTGALEVNTKEDMGAHSDMVVLWGTNLVNQPNTARYVAEAKKRGARIIAVDVRESEACGNAHESFIIRPGTDAALALAMMNVIVSEGLQDDHFIADHTVGFSELKAHLAEHTPQWAEAITGIKAERIATFAREYAATEKAMICLSGGSMHKNRHGWQSARAVTCLPALTGKLGKSGAGLGPRHGAEPRGVGTNFILDPTSRPPGEYIQNQMSDMVDAIEAGRIRTMLIFGSNFVSSFSDATRVARGLDTMDMVVCHDLFFNDTIRNHADIVLPATAWLEDVGCKMTATHLYLMDKALPAAGEARSMASIVRALAGRLGMEDFYPWEGQTGHLDAVLDHPCTGHATVEELRAEGGIRALKIDPVAHSDRQFATPSGKIEFYSERAKEHGLPPLPVYIPRDAEGYPLELRMGRTINHFHSFYDSGRALPSLAAKDARPELWMSVADARSRGIADGAAIRIHNQRGDCHVHAAVNDKVPQGTVWIHDGWPDLNTLTDGSPAIPDAATRIMPFTTGQAAYDAFVEVSQV
jgi:anaerobic selenocysteine-containing dehydrogenase